MRRSLLAVLPFFFIRTPGLAAQAQAPAKAAISADSTAALRNAVLEPAAIQGDLAMLDRTLRTLHPAVFRYHTPQSWAAAVAGVQAWAAQPRTRGETFAAFSRLVASMRCGHTYLSFWNQPRVVHHWLTDGSDKLPFEYDLIEGDRWVVTRSATFTRGDSAAVLAGDTVLSVNGVSTQALVAELLPLIRADGDNDGKRRALLDFRHRKEFEAIDVFLPLLHPPVGGRYTIVRRRGARTDTVAVASMPSAERRRVAVPLLPERPWHELSRVGGVAVLRVDRFDYGRESAKWEPFVKETFRQLRQDSVQALVLDLRENEGGSDEGAEFLLRHLSRGAITMPPLRRYVAYDTVPAALRPVLDTWDNGFYDRRGRVTPKGDGTYDLRETDAWPKQIPVAANALTGRVFVVTSYVNSSASHLLLRLLARQPGITLVGDPTGGSLRAHTGGQLFFARYPGTGFEVDVPLIAYDWGKELPAGGVLPDIAVPARLAFERAMIEAQRVVAAQVPRE